MKIAAFCLCWVLILTAPSVMAQQTTTPNQSSTAPNQSWDALRILLAGDKLGVERKTGKKKVSGKFAGMSDTELVIKRKRKNVSFSRDEVKKVWRKIPPDSSKASSASAGLAVGSLFGILSTLCDVCSTTDEVAIFVGLAAGGALIGYLIAREERLLIYSAP